MLPENKFVPATREIEIAKGIVYRPIRSWHSGVYAGEGLTTIPGTTDGSGCLQAGKLDGKLCMPPYTYTHRLYWNRKKPEITISAFLSYPDAMGVSNGDYFWEIMEVNKNGDVERFFDEAQMEKKIIKQLLK